MKTGGKILLTSVFMLIAALMVVILFSTSRQAPAPAATTVKHTDPSLLKNPTECFVNEDCLVVGVDGDCDCGCYNRTYQRPEKQKTIGTTSDGMPDLGMCFCAAPASCVCVNNTCEDRL